MENQNQDLETTILQLKDTKLNEAGAPAKTPGRKIRKLTPRNLYMGDENDDLFGIN